LANFFFTIGDLRRMARPMLRSRLTIHVSAALQFCSRERISAVALRANTHALIAPSFADIFANNSRKNGLLPVTLSDDEVAYLMKQARESAGYQLTINLEDRTVTDPDGFLARFEIADFERHCLLEGLDDIGLTLQHTADIEAFEGRRISFSTARSA
jgi:3-isopropylmalate/(R)-2-methylmalate dehydratase small subunit